MSYKPGDTFYSEFTTCNATTGAAADADSLPTAKLAKNGADDVAVTLTVAHAATGRYTVTGTIPGGYASGNSCQVAVVATVGGVVGTAIVDSWVMDGKRVSDLNDPSVAAITSSVMADTTDTIGADVLAIKQKTDAIPAFPSFFSSIVISSTGLVAMDGGRAVAFRDQDSVTTPTVDDCLSGSWTEAFAAEGVVGTTYTKKKPDKATPIRAFTLDSGTNPTTRA